MTSTDAPATSTADTVAAGGTADESGGSDTEREALHDNPKPITKRFSWTRALGFVLFPAVAIALAAAAGVLKFQDGQARQADLARTQSLHAATDAAVAMLSYTPDNVDKVLPAAEDRLTGSFRESYASLINQVVIPGAKEKKISATATVPAAASTSASSAHAVVMVYINQAIVVGSDAPTNTASAVQVTLDNVGGRWLISAFDPK